jgi:hypothetical protein
MWWPIWTRHHKWCVEALQEAANDGRSSKEDATPILKLEAALAQRQPAAPEARRASRPRAVIPSQV